MKISSIAKSVEQSLTRKIFDKASKYDNVIDFTLGDPDFKTPKGICDSACNSIILGKTRYSANSGLYDLRKAISDDILFENNVLYDAESEIIVTVGAMQGLFLSMFSILDEGDEVIIPAPYWVNYKQIVELCKGKPIIVNTYEHDGFIVNPNRVIDAVTDKTVAIIINSPNNPTGAVYDRLTLEKICKIAVENNLYVIWDECYKSIVFDDSFSSILNCGIDKDNLIIINSCSKKWSMTGWRLGYVASSRLLIEPMVKLQENIVACASLPSQYAAIEAFNNHKDDAKCFCEQFKKRRDLFVSEINKINGLSCNVPSGTFYAMVNISETGLCSEEFAVMLLEQQKVAVVPGITYGECSEGYVRIAFTVDEKKILEGIRRIKCFVNSLL